MKTIVQTVLFLLLVVTAANAQLEVTPSVFSSVQIAGSKTIGDVTLFPLGAKVVVTQVAVIHVESPAKFVRVRAYKSLFETATVTKLTEKNYMLTGAAGRYAVEVTTFDPTNGIEEKSIEVTIAEPDVPIDDGVVLSGVAKDARSAIVSFVQGMAKDMQAVSDAAKAGQVKTVIEASAASKMRDEATRETFKRTMAKTMEPLLGNGPLPANAPQVFSDISKGFGGVK